MSECKCGNSDILVFGCSGGSNVGQIANDAAIALDRLGQGRMYCAIGVGGGIGSFVETANGASKRVAIDGCEVQCLKKSFEKAGVPIDVHVVVTDHGIAKGHHFDHTPEQAQAITDITVQALTQAK